MKKLDDHVNEEDNDLPILVDLIDGIKGSGAEVTRADLLS